MDLQFLRGLPAVGEAATRFDQALLPGGGTMPVGRLFLLRDDPSMRRRSNDGSNVPLNTALALSGVRYFVEAVPSGRVLLHGDTKRLRISTLPLQSHSATFKLICC